MELTPIQHIMVCVDMELLCQRRIGGAGSFGAGVPVVIVQVDMEEQVYGWYGRCRTYPDGGG